MVLATILFLLLLNNLFLWKTNPDKQAKRETQKTTLKPTKNVPIIKTKINALFIHFTLLV